MSDLSRFYSRFKRNQAVWTQRRHTRGRPAPRAHIALQPAAFHGRYVTMATPHTAQHLGGNGSGYDDATSEMYDFFVPIQAFNLLTVGDRAICPRPLPRATQSVPRACIVDLKLASASASVYRRSRGVELVFDLTGWANRRSHWRRADPPASTDTTPVEPGLTPDVMSVYGRCTSNSIHVCQWSLRIEW